MILDFSKLSRGMRYRLLSYIEKECSKESYRMKQAIPTFHDGEPKNDMIRWQNACSEIEEAARKLIAADR